MNSPIFILGSHKSGTTMLRGLLDGVPGVFSIPIETHIFEYTGYWVDYELRRSIPRKLTFEQVLGNIQKSIEKSNKKSNWFARYGGDSLVESQWDVPALVKSMNKNGRKSFENNDLKGFISAYFEGLYFSLFSELPPKSLRYVEKSVENAEFAGLLKKLFPDAKFIHVIRNPYATIVSIRKYMALRGNYPYLGWVIDALENNYYHSTSNPQFISDYLIVRYEDLIINTESKMHEVAKFLDLPFSQPMLTPTVLGKLWPGNSVSGESFTGISSTPVHSWENHITPIEIALVNSNFGHILDTYNYEKLNSKSTPFSISKKEGVRNYLANRFFWQISSKRRKIELD
jgi:protein-tyrosine sulfotransferase